MTWVLLDQVMPRALKGERAGAGRGGQWGPLIRSRLLCGTLRHWERGCRKCGESRWAPGGAFQPRELRAQRPWEGLGFVGWTLRCLLPFRSLDYQVMPHASHSPRLVG